MICKFQYQIYVGLVDAKEFLRDTIILALKFCRWFLGRKLNKTVIWTCLNYLFRNFVALKDRVLLWGFSLTMWEFAKRKKKLNRNWYNLNSHSRTDVCANTKHERMIECGLLPQIKITKSFNPFEPFLSQNMQHNSDFNGFKIIYIFPAHWMSNEGLQAGCSFHSHSRTQSDAPPHLDRWLEQEVGNVNFAMALKTPRNTGYPFFCSCFPGESTSSGPTFKGSRKGQSCHVLKEEENELCAKPWDHYRTKAILFKSLEKGIT